MDNLSKIQRMSRIFRGVMVFLLVLGPLVVVLFWLLYNQLPLSFHEPVKGIIPLERFLPLAVRLGVAGVNMLSLAVTSGVLWTLYQLFGFYQKSEIFSSNNVKCYRRLGLLLILWAPAGILTKSLLGAILSLTNPPGQRTLSFGVSSGDLSFVLVGFIVLCISWVMAEGVYLQNEKNLTI